MVWRNISVRQCLFSLLFLSGIFTFPAAVFADVPPSGMFVVRPGKVELTMMPGETKVVNITLNNGTPFPLRVETSREDIAATTQVSPVDAPIALVSEGGGGSSINNFLTFGSAPLQLLSGKETIVPITIHIPESVEPGGRYGAVVFEFSQITSPDIHGAASVQVKNRIATTLYVRIAGNVKEEGKLVAFGLFNGAHYASLPSEANPIRFQVAYENTGRVHVNPYGRITVTSLFGGVHILPIDPWVVLPGATRMREIDLTDPLSPGYYTAHLEQNRGYKNIVDERDTYFWVLPSLMQVIFFITGLLVIVMLIRRSLKISRNSVS